LADFPDRTIAASSGLWSFEAVPASVGAARRVVRQVAGHHLAADQDRDAVALCVSEAVSNVVVHAYRGLTLPGRVELQANRADDFLCVWVRDRGRGFLPSRESPGLGLGLPLMASLAERFEVNRRDGGGTEIALAFTLE
jgi:anti-sigma regulatory factor (Ser/Thr protein kinase)